MIISLKPFHIFPTLQLVPQCCTPPFGVEVAAGALVAEEWFMVST